MIDKDFHMHFRMNSFFSIDDGTHGNVMFDKNGSVTMNESEAVETIPNKKTKLAETPEDFERIFQRENEAVKTHESEYIYTRIKDYVNEWLDFQKTLPTDQRNGLGEYYSLSLSFLKWLDKRRLSNTNEILKPLFKEHLKRIEAHPRMKERIEDWKRGEDKIGCAAFVHVLAEEFKYLNLGTAVRKNKIRFALDRYNIKLKSQYDTTKKNDLETHVSTFAYLHREK